MIAQQRDDLTGFGARQYDEAVAPRLAGGRRREAVDELDREQIVAGQMCALDVTVARPRLESQMADRHHLRLARAVADKGRLEFVHQHRFFDRIEKCFEFDDSHECPLILFDEL